MSEEQKDHDVKHYSVTFSLDRGNFFRRACPDCGRHFKTAADPADLVHVLQPAFRQIEPDFKAETTAGQVIEAPSQTILHCPYCGHSAESSEMLTAEFEEYIKRYAYREMVLPKIRKMFSGLADSFGRHGSRSGGFISFEVRFEASEDILPPRPLAGPEPPDMVRVKMLCCEKHAKILDGWKSSIFCPYCGIVGILQ